MNLTTAIKKSIDRSVLCWLATVSEEGMPNVSPKEVFTYYGTDSIIIANIASPQTVKNIKTNTNVCVSFIDVLVQKGYQLKGKAAIIIASDPDFESMYAVLTKMTGGKFPFQTITQISLGQVKPIIAPRYRFYPETTEEAQIASAKKAYGIS